MLGESSDFGLGTGVGVGVLLPSSRARGESRVSPKLEFHGHIVAGVVALPVGGRPGVSSPSRRLLDRVLAESSVRSKAVLMAEEGRLGP